MAGVDEGVPDLDSARDQIRSVVIGAELGRGSRSGLYHHQGIIKAVLLPSADRPAVDELKGIWLWLGFGNA